MIYDQKIGYKNRELIESVFFFFFNPFHFF